MGNKPFGLVQAHAWEDWAWIWSVVFFGSLILPLVLLLPEQQLTATQWQAAAALTGVALLVHAVAFWGLPAWGTHLRARLLFGVIYVVVLAVLTAGLLAIHPTFFFVLSGFFSQLFFGPLQTLMLLANCRYMPKPEVHALKIL